MEPSQLIKMTDAKVVVDELCSLLSADTPRHLLQENPQKNGTEISFSSIFSILTHIRMQDGWTADYDYHYGGIGGEPIVYALGRSGERENLLSHVVADESPEGWFQLALFTVMRNQFYRYWHAGYGYISPVVSSSDIEKLPAPVGSRLTEDIVCPSIEINDDGRIKVVLCVFREHGGGAFRITFAMNRHFPHEIKDVASQGLAPHRPDYIY